MFKNIVSLLFHLPPAQCRAAITDKFFNFVATNVFRVMQIIIRDTDDLPRAAREFLDAAGSRRVFAFHGGMGAGKTTFISALCHALGVVYEPSSPTFAIVNEYADSCGKPLYHFDFYRVESTEEALYMGMEDYFYSGSYCFVEWPEVALPLMPADTVHVRIEVDELTGARVVTI